MAVVMGLQEQQMRAIRISNNIYCEHNTQFFVGMSSDMWSLRTFVASSDRLHDNRWPGYDFPPQYG